MDISEYNTPETIPTGEKPGEGGGNDSQPQDAFQVIKEAFPGRNFATFEDAKKALKDTVSYVGKAGEKEKLIGDLAKKLELTGEAEVKEWIEALGDKKPDAKPDPIAATTDKISELEFKAEHPDEKEFLPFLKKLAKAEGKTLDEARSLPEYQDYTKAKKGLAERQQESSVIETNNRIGFQTDNLKPLAEAVKTNPTDVNKDALVKEALFKK